ncbi:MAG TPA: NADH-ubiquinone oxidoreductase-F iron-sulfur binding region domain-containing protein, partial [Acidimicrobiales bacterium]|nr:NADH-ubiquinone oxidoreductase-F iron-sulfur binding region domain-containing protein [Acidimicrobiales bacterium]
AGVLSGLVSADFLGAETLPVAVLATTQLLSLNGISQPLGQAELRAAARASTEASGVDAVAGLLRAAVDASWAADDDTEITAPRAVSSRLGLGNAHELDGFLATSGYTALRKAVADLTPEDVQAEVLTSGITGRSGGAAFPTATKWSILADRHPRYLVVNGDESEPGFFKDRRLMEADPHQLIEGALIAAYALGADLVVIYVRGEMVLAQERLTRALNDAYLYGAVGSHILGSGFSCDVVLHPGAGAYIVGEETAMLESLEGKRGFPRIKPPGYPAVNGLYGQPTIVNNVETLATLPWIIRNGGAAYAALGGGRYSGTRLFCLSGAIRRPGLYEVELHRTTFRHLLFDASMGGGMANDSPITAFVPGASFPWLFPEHLELPLDGDEVTANGSSLGGGIIVLDEATCPVRVAWRLVRFFHRESCGQCTPCREGTGWMEKVLRRIESGAGRAEDLDLLLDVGDNISPAPFPHPARPELGHSAVPFPYQQSTICPLGPSAVSPVESSIWRFRDVYLDHVRQGCCPFEHRSLVSAG